MLDVIETLLVIVLLGVFGYALTRDVPERRCDGDCAHCPFPPCWK